MVQKEGRRGARLAEAEHGGAIAADEVSSSELAGNSFLTTPNKNKTPKMISATRRTR